MKKPFHNIVPLDESQLKMDWTMVRVHGVGLINRAAAKTSLNICYINSIIQCLANTAPFVQWLLNDDIHSACKLSIE